MDINQQLQPIVAGLIDSLKLSIEQELRAQVTDEVVNKIASTELTSIVESIVSQRLTERIAQYNFDAAVKQQLDVTVNQLTETVSKSLATAANHQITEAINLRVANMDINQVINQVVKAKMDDMIQTQSFPQQSIPHSSIDFRGLGLTGDQVKGGIIENFGSTGIEDRATTIRMTLMDQAVAFEGPVWTPEIKVKGSAHIDGDLTVTGKVFGPLIDSLVAKSAETVLGSLNTELFTNYSDIVTRQIKENGLDLDKITQSGREIVKGSQLGYHITDTNIQRVGIVRDLQTAGENLLSDTLYVSNKRVGVNTIDPGSALAVWDEEVEITVGKRSQDVAYISAPRRQALVLGSNNQENIRLDVDGSVQVSNLTVGKLKMSSAATVPNYSGQPGEVVWNEQPSLGGPMGWVCLGATRWANFGIID